MEKSLQLRVFTGGILLTMEWFPWEVVAGHLFHLKSLLDDIQEVLAEGWRR